MAIRERLNVLVSEQGAKVRFDTVIQMYQVWFRDQEIQRSNDSTYFGAKSGKAPRDPKAFLLTVEQQKRFRDCTRLGACYECYKKVGNMNQKWTDCEKHNRKKDKFSKKRGDKNDEGTTSKVKLARFSSECSDFDSDAAPELMSESDSEVEQEFVVSSYLAKKQESGIQPTVQQNSQSVLSSVQIATDKLKDLLAEATEAVEGASEDLDLSALYHHEYSEDVPVKMNSVLLIDSGAATTTVPSTLGLTNIKRLERHMNLEYADGNKGSPIVDEGSLLLNGRELRALISPDLHDGLISTGQLDKEFNATTVQSCGRSISFIPDECQQQVLNMLFEEMDPNNVLAEAELNEDELYQVQLSRDSSKILSVSVFPRVAVNSLSQAVYLLHASLGRMPKEAMIHLAKSTHSGGAERFRSASYD